MIHGGVLTGSFGINFDPGRPRSQRASPRLLEDVVTTLFLSDKGGDWHPPGGIGGTSPHVKEDDAPVPGVSQEEMAKAVKRMGAKNTASGPNGIPGRARILLVSVLGERLRQLFDNCLEQGQFPQAWKTGRSYYGKTGAPRSPPPRTAPLCCWMRWANCSSELLQPASRPTLRGRAPTLPGGSLNCQFGFREGRSTVDAIQRVRSLSAGTVSRGGVVLVVSLDISNAFNTLS